MMRHCSKIAEGKDFQVASVELLSTQQYFLSVPQYIQGKSVVAIHSICALSNFYEGMLEGSNPGIEGHK